MQHDPLAFITTAFISQRPHRADAAPLPLRYDDDGLAPQQFWPFWKKTIMTMTIPALMRDAAARYGDRAALVSHADGAMSFRDLDRQADLVAKALLADGAQPGDRAAIWAPNMWEWVAVAIGIQRAAGVMVPLNTRLKGGELADIIRRGQIKRYSPSARSLADIIRTCCATKPCPACVVASSCARPRTNWGRTRCGGRIS
jgi:acyl-CoA synthetase (AMP-forming)/AMP-acid ligase II